MNAYYSCTLLLAETSIRVREVCERAYVFLVDAMSFDLTVQARAVAMFLMVDCRGHLLVCLTAIRSNLMQCAAVGEFESHKIWRVRTVGMGSEPQVIDQRDRRIINYGTPSPSDVCAMMAGVNRPEAS